MARAPQASTALPARPLRGGLADAVPEVEADKVQLQQVLVNLFVNARDSIGDICDAESHYRRLMTLYEREIQGGAAE